MSDFAKAKASEKTERLARFDLIPVPALTELATLYGKSAAKYPPRDWEQGAEFSSYYGALQRHANSWWGGEDCDPEMGVSHLASVAWNAFALLTLLATHPDFDDRPKRSGSPATLDPRVVLEPETFFVKKQGGES